LGSVKVRFITRPRESLLTVPLENLEMSERKGIIFHLQFKGRLSP
jgi:hypothetical protein